MRLEFGASAAAIAFALAGAAQAQTAQQVSPPDASPAQTVATPGGTPTAAQATSAQPTPSQQAGANPDKPTAQASQPIVTRGAPKGDNGVISYPASFFADAKPSTAYDMLDRVPGFSLDTGDSSVRGYADSGGNVLIDGERPATKTDSLAGALRRIPATDVDRIELIRGGVPGIDMQGRTVLANVVRKSGDTKRVTLTGSDNLFLGDGHTVPGGNVQYTQRFGKQSIDLQLSRYTGYDDSVGNGRVFTTLAGQPTTSEQASTTGDGGGYGFTAIYKGPVLGGDLRANLKLEESYFKGSLDYGFPTPDTAVDDRSRQHDGEIGLDYDRKFGKLEVETTFLEKLEHDFSGEVADYPGEQDVQSDVQDTNETIARTTLRYPLFKTLTIEGGGEFTYNSLDGKNLLTTDGAPVDLPSSLVHVNEKRGETFLQGTWTISPKLTLEAGMRLEFTSIGETGDAPMERSFFYPKPRAVLTWSPTKNDQVRLRVEKKVGQLNFSDFVTSADLKTGVVNAGNPDLRPDQRWEYEVSVEHRFWDKGAIVLTATHAELTDATDLVPVITDAGVIDAPGNIGSGTDDTLDLELTLPLDKFGLKHAQIKSSNIWRDSSVTDPTTFEKRRITEERPWTQNVEFSQDLTKWSSTWGLVYDRTWHESYFRAEEIDRYHISPSYVQFYYEYKPKPDLSIRFEADNLVPFTFTQDQMIYSGLRSDSPVAEDIKRVIQSQQRLFLRIRKTFG